MGSVIPIKVAEGHSFSEKLKMWDTGESCPKKVLAPQKSKVTEITPPINHKELSPQESSGKYNSGKINHADITAGHKIQKNDFFTGEAFLEPGFFGVNGRRNNSMTEKRCYTVKELQEILGVSRPSVYELLKKNEFRSYVI